MLKNSDYICAYDFGNRFHGTSRINENTALRTIDDPPPLGKIRGNHRESRRHVFKELDRIRIDIVLQRPQTHETGNAARLNVVNARPIDASEEVNA